MLELRPERLEDGALWAIEYKFWMELFRRAESLIEIPEPDVTPKRAVLVKRFGGHGAANRSIIDCTAGMSAGAHSKLFSSMAGSHFTVSCSVSVSSPELSSQ